MVLKFGAGRGFGHSNRKSQGVGGSSPPVSTFTVLSASGASYSTARTALAADGTSYTVPQAVLSAGGTSYNAI